MKLSKLNRENKWNQVRDRYEIESATNGVTLILNQPKLHPFALVIRCFILGFVSTVYANAYSLNNPTRMLYVQKLSDLMAFDGYSTPEDGYRLQEAFKKALKIMPKGFRTSFIKNNSFWVCEKPLTLKKAQEFLDWLNSQAFEDMLIRNFHDSTQLNFISFLK